ncbi:MAG: aminoglycoside phosphotransferase family protein [Eubacteriaceae bacterium]|nr:aminoglycoside phosphotransferase family protein [Eubacteriaceae bacterium]
MGLFKYKICSWADWEKIYDNPESFLPLVRHIFERECLPFNMVETLDPGTNAVFKVGSLVVKIFAPKQAGMSVGTNFAIESFGMEWAKSQGVGTPNIVASGFVEDKYTFLYIIMEMASGISFAKTSETLSFDEKLVVGQRLRDICDKLNKPCGDFGSIDVVENAINYNEWHGYPQTFKEERLGKLAMMDIDKQARVFCHGDLNSDNVFIDRSSLVLSLIDFADAVFAPAGYEHALVACELFAFEAPYMQGFFGSYIIDEIVDLCATWLPVHDSGEFVLANKIGPLSEIASFDVMRERLHKLASSKAATT